LIARRWHLALFDETELDEAGMTRDA